MSGTPKTLEDAIQNGIVEGVEQAVNSVGRSPLAKTIIAKHVKDFLSQKFGAAMLMYEDNTMIQELWESINK